MKRLALLLMLALGAGCAWSLRINEFLASNDSGLKDSFGKHSDWIEIYNNDGRAVNLQGWGLSDSQKKPYKWTFPSTNLVAGAYLLVFASDREENRPGKELHCGFKLSADGEYLGLTSPEGVTVSEFAPVFPAQRADISYGWCGKVRTSKRTLLPERSACRAFVPRDGSLDNVWYRPEFDDSAWLSGKGGVGYERSPGSIDFSPYIGLDINSAMYNVNCAAFMRFPFVLDRRPDLAKLTLSMLYDDAFIAYLNGHEIYRDRLMMGQGWQAYASTYREEAITLTWEDLDITEFQRYLVEGTNVLAIVGVNNTTTSTDFLMYPKITGEEVTLIDNEFLGFMDSPSPGSVNGEGYKELLADLVPSRAPGFYESSFKLSLTCASSGSTIIYTLDGTTPRPGVSQVYSGRLDISGTTIVRAMAYCDDERKPSLFTGTYIFLDDVIAQKDGQAPGPLWPTGTVNGQKLDYGMDQDITKNAKYKDLLKPGFRQIPTLSIVCSPANLFNTSSGIYVNAWSDGRNWERQAHLELLNPDGSQGFSVGCGLRIRGGFSRGGGEPKHSFRLFFRREWGPSKLKFPLFGDEGVDSFKKVDLRTAQNYSWTYGDDPYQCVFCRDVFARDLLLAFGEPCTRSRYYHILLNGHYWGLYQTEERPEENFGESYLGGDEEDYDVIKPEGYHAKPNAGNDQAWNALWAMATNGFSRTSYFKATGRDENGIRNISYPVLLDATNVADVTLVNYIVANHDSPFTTTGDQVNNFYALYNRKDPAGFKFICHDNEHAMVKAYLNSDLTGSTSTGWRPDYFNSTFLHQRLLDTKEYKQVFISRVCLHYFNYGPATQAAMQDLFMSRADSINLAVVCESARWGDVRTDYGSALPFNRDRDWQPMVNYLRDTFLPNRRTVTLQQFRNRGWFPACDPPALSRPSGRAQRGDLVKISGRYSILYTTDGSDPWTSSTAQTYTEPIELRGTTRLRCCYRPSSCSYNMPAEATYTILEPCPLVVTEIMYSPKPPTVKEIGSNPTAEVLDTRNYGFVELYNPSAEDFYPAGQYLTGSVSCVFPPDTPAIQAGHYAVIVPSKEAFTRRYGKFVAPRVIGTYKGYPEGSVISLCLTNYSLRASAQWYPEAASGQGYSLVAVSNALPYAEYSKKAAWRTSYAVNGSPGEEDVPEPAAAAAALLALGLAARAGRRRSL